MTALEGVASGARHGLRAIVLDPVSDSRWSAALRDARSASVFHHPSWIGLLADHYGYDVTAVCVVGEDDTVIAGMPVARIRSRLTGTRLVALPFSDICPPLLTDAAPADGAARVADALDEARRDAALRLEVRWPLAGADAAVAPRFWRHTLALEDDPSAVERRFAKSQVRRGIAKARRAGLTIERRTDRDALERFYALHLCTRRHQGVPTQPKRFILGLERLFAQGLGFVLLATLEEDVLAAAVFLTLNGTLTYKYGASDRRHLDKRPNNLLFAEAIRIGCAEGSHTLDFGRTDYGNEGLRAFKRSWGADEHDLAYAYFGGDPPDAAHGWRDRLVAGAIRRGPDQVGRAVGELLYRHFG